MLAHATTPLSMARRSAHVLVALSAMATTGARSSLAFRAEVIVGAATLLARVLLVTAVWRTVYDGRNVVSGVGVDDAVTYAVLAAILGNVLNPWQISGLQSRIRQGRVAGDLLRPIGLVPQTLAQQVGIMLASLPRAAMGLTLAAALGSLSAAVTGLSTIVAFVVSTLAGAVIALLTNLVVAMSAFWTTDIGGPLILYRAVAQLASGALIPLWFMPSWLRTMLEWLPFQAQLFLPVSIFLGQTEGWQVGWAITRQVFWIGVMWLLADMVWRRAVRRVVISGG